MMLRADKTSSVICRRVLEIFRQEEVALFLREHYQDRRCGGDVSYCWQYNDVGCRLRIRERVKLPIT